MRKHKLLILFIPLLIILSALVIYEYAYLSVQDELAAASESAAVKTKTLQKYIQLIAEKPELEKLLAALKEQRKADEAKLVEGQTFSLAAATLQDTVKGIITSRGGTISSERVGKPEDLKGFKVINISIDAVIPDTRVLGDIIYSLETRTPYLVVKEVDTRVRNIREPRDLIVKFDVIALTAVK